MYERIKTVVRLRMPPGIQGKKRQEAQLNSQEKDKKATMVERKQSHSPLLGEDAGVQRVENENVGVASFMNDPPPGYDQASRCMVSFQIWCNPEHPTIADELRGMPRESRELVWVDLSGNRKGSMYYQDLDPKLEETKENVERAMQELDIEIQRLPTFTLLRKVQQQNPEYINSPSFRMQFLRCERFNSKQAITRMMRYFDEKRKLWGEDCLGRDISFADLDQEDLECLSGGGHTILRNRDSGGRRIYLSNRGALKDSKPKPVVSGIGKGTHHF